MSADQRPRGDMTQVERLHLHAKCIRITNAIADLADALRAIGSGNAADDLLLEARRIAATLAGATQK